MGRTKETSWLFGPPETENPTGEQKLWWGVIRQAAKDLRYGRRSVALDGLEYLRDSGCYLLSWLFGIPLKESRVEIAHLVHERNRYHNEPLDDSAVRHHPHARIHP